MKTVIEGLRVILGFAILYCIILIAQWALSSAAYWLVWHSTPAPWEEVHAFFYPDATDLTNDRRSLDIGSLEACRKWAQDLASVTPTHSSYECGIGCKSWEGTDMFVCRLTVR